MPFSLYTWAPSHSFFPHAIMSKAGLVNRPVAFAFIFPSSQRYSVDASAAAGFLPLFFEFGLIFFPPLGLLY